MLPLGDLTVVALEHAVAAPFATRQLADLGARVIKIERPGVGDFARGYDTTVRGLSSHFVWLNRSKESLTLDVKRPQGRDVLRRLLGRADVFIHNLAPGAIDRLGFATPAVRAQFPRMIICNLSGYGSTGPYRDKKAYDLLIQSETGVLSITGTEEAPAKVGISVADIAGGMYAFSGILTALIARGKTGAGAALEVSLFEALGEWMSYAAYFTMYTGTPPPRTGASHAVIAPYGPFRAGDGRVVYLGIQNEREWTRFCEQILGNAALATDARFGSVSARMHHRVVLNGLIEQAFQSLTAAEIIDRLERAQIANARMNTVPEFLDHPQLSARGRWREVDSPVGPIRALIPPATFEGGDVVMGAIPEVGAHTDAILEELGYGEATRAGWRTAGII